MSKTGLAGLGLALALTHGTALGAAGDAAKGVASKAPAVKGADVAKADAARKKPLQRCDELADKAQLECLQKARERIVEARQKREASATSAGTAAKPDAPPKDAPKN